MSAAPGEGRPARVLWVIKGLGPGGAERLVADIVPRLDRDRYDTEVAYLLPWKDHLVPTLRDAGVEVHCLEVRGHRDVRWPGRLRRLVDGRYDLVHAHLPFAAVGARWTARRIPLPRRPAVVYTEHNVWDRYRGPTAWANARTFGWNDRVIAVSEAVRASMGRRGRSPEVTVVDNGVDAEALRAGALGRAEARAELGLPADAFVIGTVGGVTPKKGHVHLVRAARAVVDRHPGTVVAVIGLGAVEAPVRQEIARLGLGEAVRLLGVREDASRLMPAFDVFVLPSLHEGLPIALLEALAVGIPAVASSVGGVPHVLSAGGGVLVAPGDEPALAAALVALIEDPQRRAALAAEAPAAAGRFGLDRTVRELQAIYDDVLATRR